MDVLPVIRDACAQLRRLPEPQWAQAPRAPLGARSPHVAPETGGTTVEALAREWTSILMKADAELRGVNPFDVRVHHFALPDVIEALAKSLAASSHSKAQTALEQVAREMQTY